MTMHINFIQRQCTVCDRLISVPNIGRHIEACERKRAALVEAERVQEARDEGQRERLD